MKKILYFVAAAAVSVLALMLGAFSACTTKASDKASPAESPAKAESKLAGDTLLKYTYTEYADMAEPVCEYEIEVTDSPSSAVLTITNSEVDSWFRWVPIDVLRHVQDMLVAAKVDTFKKSYQNPDVMDGYSWVFKADYASGKHVSSSGTNAGPSKAFKEINEYLDSIYREAENKIKDY